MARHLQSSFGKQSLSSKPAKGAVAKSKGIQVKGLTSKRLTSVTGMICNVNKPLDFSLANITYVETHNDGTITGNVNINGKIHRCTLTHRVEIVKRKTIHGYVDQIKKSNPVWMYA